MSIRVRNLALYEGVDHGLHIQSLMVELEESVLEKRNYIETKQQNQDHSQYS